VNVIIVKKTLAPNEKKRGLIIAENIKIVVNTIKDIKVAKVKPQQQIDTAKIIEKNVVIALKENTLKTDIVKIIVAENAVLQLVLAKAIAPIMLILVLIVQKEYPNIMSVVTDASKNISVNILTVQ